MKMKTMRRVEVNVSCFPLPRGSIRCVKLLQLVSEGNGDRDWTERQGTIEVLCVIREWCRVGLDNTENNGSRSRSRGRSHKIWCQGRRVWGVCDLRTGLVEFGLLMSLLVCAARHSGLERAGMQRGRESLFKMQASLQGCSLVRVSPYLWHKIGELLANSCIFGPCLWALGNSNA